MPGYSGKIQLRNIIRDRFNQSEFELLCANLGVPSDEFAKPTFELRALALIEYYERRNNIYHLIETIRVERLDIDLSSLPKSPIATLQETSAEFSEPNQAESKRDRVASQTINMHPDINTNDEFSIAFANRVYELEGLSNPLGPMYTLIDAPAGFGKTRLLQELKNRYATFKENDKTNIWTCIFIDLRDYTLLQSKANIIDAVGEQIKSYTSLRSNTKDEDRIVECARAIHQNPDIHQITLLFDSVENIPDELRSWFIFDFVIRIFEYLSDIGFHNDGRKFRAIFAGRYVASKWQNLTYGKMILSIIYLRPFDLVAITETVRGVINKNSSGRPNVKLTEEGINDLSYNIMRITGGHPGCMAAILRQLIEKKFIGFRRYAEQSIQKQIYHDIVKPFINIIKQGIPNRLQSAFSILSVYRRFNREAIESLLKQQKISWSFDSEDTADPAWGLLQEMRSTHLIERREGFYSDAIVRRLLTIEMRQEHPKLFRELCEGAERFYISLMNDPGMRSPHLIVVEALYQRLQLHSINQNPSHPEILADMQNIIRSYMALERSYIVRDELLEDLRTAINADWELRYLAKDILGYDDLQTTLLSKLITDSLDEEASDAQ